MNNLTDEELVGLIQKGDILSFETLVKRYQRSLFSFVPKIIKSQDFVEDIVSETFFKIYTTIDRIDTNRKFSTYAFEIAKNAAISYLRKRKNNVSLEKVAISTNENHLENLEKDEEVTKVNRAVGKLAQKYREVIRFYYFKELSYLEISDKLKLPLNTVRTRLKRAKKFLERELRK